MGSHGDNVDDAAWLAGFDQVPDHTLRLAPEGHDRRRMSARRACGRQRVQAGADIEVLLEDWRA